MLSSVSYRLQLVYHLDYQARIMISICPTIDEKANKPWCDLGRSNTALTIIVANIHIGTDDILATKAKLHDIVGSLLSTPAQCFSQAFLEFAFRALLPRRFNPR